MRNVKEYQAIFDRLADGLREKARGLKDDLDEAFESDYEKALTVITELIEVFTRLKTLSNMGGPFVSLLESIERVETLREEIVDRAGKLGPEFLRYRTFSRELHDLGLGEFERLFAAETGDPDFRFDLSLDDPAGLECIRRLAPEAFGDAQPLVAEGSVEPAAPAVEAPQGEGEPTELVDPLGAEQDRSPDPFGQGGAEAEAGEEELHPAPEVGFASSVGEGETDDGEPEGRDAFEIPAPETRPEVVEEAEELGGLGVSGLEPEPFADSEPAASDGALESILAAAEASDDEPMPLDGFEVPDGQDEDDPVGGASPAEDDEPTPLAGNPFDLDGEPSPFGEKPEKAAQPESLIGLLQEEPETPEPAPAAADGDDLEDEVRKELERIRKEALGTLDDD